MVAAARHNRWWVDGQLELPLDVEEELAGHGMQRLGETPEFGFALLQLLGSSGWEIVVTRAFAGGSLVIASRGGYEVRRTGETVAAVAAEVYREAMRLPGGPVA